MIIREEPAWCPGCGNFGILKAFKEALVELGLEPHEFTIVSGIGQAAKFPHYIRCKPSTACTAGLCPWRPASN